MLGQPLIRVLIESRDNGPWFRNPVPGWKNRLVGTVKDDIVQANEVVWPAMVAGVSHMGNVGLESGALMRVKPRRQEFLSRIKEVDEKHSCA